MGIQLGDHQYSSQFLTYVDQVLLDLVHNAFWTEGQWYNMTTTRGLQKDLFSLYYAKPEIELITDPTGVYDKKDKKSKRELPFIIKVLHQQFLAKMQLLLQSSVEERPWTLRPLP